MSTEKTAYSGILTTSNTLRMTTANEDAQEATLRTFASVTVYKAQNGYILVPDENRLAQGGPMLERAYIATDEAQLATLMAVHFGLKRESQI